MGGFGRERKGFGNIRSVVEGGYAVRNSGQRWGDIWKFDECFVVADEKE